VRVSIHFFLLPSSQTAGVQRDLQLADYVHHWSTLHAQVVRSNPDLACFSFDQCGSLANMNRSPQFQFLLSQDQAGIAEEDMEAMLPVERRMVGWLHFVAQSVEAESR